MWEKIHLWKKLEDLDNRLNSIIDERKTLVSEYESIEIKADNSLEKSEIEIKDLPKEIPNNSPKSKK